MLLFSADMLQLSMSLDGVIYSAIAQLFAQGQGSYWALPHFEAGIGAFYDHPPLGLWLLSFWTQWLGADFWVERSFLFVLIVVFCWGVGLLWYTCTPQPPGTSDKLPRNNVWWVLLLLLCMPVVGYTLTNNILEALLAVFTLWAVVFAWFGLQRPWLNLITGLLCCAAIVTKGPVGLFPLLAPAVFAWCLLGSTSKAVSHTFLALVPLFLLAAMIFFHAPARLVAVAYLDTQLVGTFTGLRIPENGRLYLVGQFATNMAIAAAVCLLISRARFEFSVPKVFWAYLLIGVCAFLPLLLSPRQYKHYLLSCLPYFALALALLARPAWPLLKARWLWGATAVVVLLIAVRVGMSYGQPGKDEIELADVSVLTSIVADGAQTEVAFCDTALRRRAYLARYALVQSYHVPLKNLADVPLGTVYVCDEDPGEGFIYLQGLHEGLQVWRRTGV